MNARLFTLLVLANACGGNPDEAHEQSAVTGLPLCPPGQQCFWVTNTLDSGPGSLRQAIEDANDRAGRDQILFGIPGAGPHVITTSGFFVTDPIVINGYSQAGARRANATSSARIVIELEAATSNGDGIAIVADDSTIVGLAVHGFGGGGGIGSAIYIEGDDNEVNGCHIGTDASGTVPIANQIGVAINGQRNVVGGLTIGKRNIIGAAEASAVSANFCLDCSIIGNHIGTDASGTIDLGSHVGVYLDEGSVVVGGVEPGARNLISGNGTGVEIDGSGHRIEGNYFGTDVSGTLGGFARANSTAIAIESGATGNFVGGTAAGAGNLIANSRTGYGVRIDGDENHVEGNLIGTDVSGTVALGNAVGVGIFGHRNVVGGTTPEARNVISGNTTQGIQISTLFGVTSPMANRVQGNFIGVNISGTAPLGNGEEGIWVFGGVLNLIGGQIESAGNIISGNGADGVLIEQPPSGNNVANVVQGNQIGTNASSANLGNGGSGVRVIDGLNHWIGGGQNLSNRIAYNHADGVTIESGEGHAVLSNAIWNNWNLAIDLGPSGPTPNDGLGDPDAGANGLQNAPTIDAVTRTGINEVTIAWSLETTPNVNVRVELFQNFACKSPNATRFLGSDVVMTDATGFASGQLVVTGLRPGELVSATASEIVGPLGRNTSEVSPCVVVK